MKKILTKWSLCSVLLISSSTFVYANDPAIEAGKIRSAVCMGCHGLQGEGKEPLNGQPAFPRISGQIKGYFVKSVIDYKTDKRNDPMMSAIAKGLSDDDINNLALYYASLK